MVIRRVQKSLFEMLLEESEGKEPFALMSTHPLTEERIEFVRDYGAKGNRDVVSLPNFLPSKPGS